MHPTNRRASSYIITVIIVFSYAYSVCQMCLFISHNRIAYVCTNTQITNVDKIREVFRLCNRYIAGVITSRHATMIRVHDKISISLSLSLSFLSSLSPSV